MPTKLTPKTLLAGFPADAIAAQLVAAYRASPRPQRTAPRATPAPFAPMPSDAPRRTRRSTVRTVWESDQKVTVLHPRNPYRPGTKAALTYALFKLCADQNGQGFCTVGDIRRAATPPEDYDLGYLRYASRDGYIKIGED